MLLTSSQVSIAIFSAVIVSFTFALFLSGYLVQQSMLKSLRAAIAPEIQRQRPLINLPDKFREQDYPVTELIAGAGEDNQQSSVGTTYAENTGETLAQGDDVSASKSEENEQHLSRAERRKKIKQEILLAGEGEGFKGYRRRMW